MGKRGRASPQGPHDDRAAPPRMLSAREAAWLGLVLIAAFCFIARGTSSRLLALALGLETEGQVQGGRIETNLKGRQRHLLRVSYSDPEGGRQVGEFPVGRGRYALLGSATALAPVLVRVRYLRAAPSIAGLVEDGGYSSTMLRAFGIVIGFFGVATPVTHWFRLRRYRRQHR